MKELKIIVFILFIGYTLSAQNATITVGRGTNCFGRGLCSITNTSISNSSSQISNASFIIIKDSITVLRIYRDKLSKDESDRILGEPITSKNIDSLEFIMEEVLSIPTRMQQYTAVDNVQKIRALEIKTYPTEITEKYIDITITKKE